MDKQNSNIRKVFIEDTLPAYAYINIRQDNQFVTNSAILKEIKRWMLNLPFVNYYSKISSAELKKKEPSVQVVLAFYEQNSSFVNLDFNNELHTKSRRALHTIVSCYQDGNYPLESFGWIKDWIDEHNI